MIYIISMRLPALRAPKWDGSKAECGLTCTSLQYRQHQAVSGIDWKWGEMVVLVAVGVVELVDRSLHVNARRRRGS
jgi:hypothetical protein